MPNIINIPRRFIDEHIAYHDSHGRHGGGGANFLNWHYEFIARFRAWTCKLLGEDHDKLKKATEPWTAVPCEVRKACKWSQKAEADLANIDERIANSATLDDLASFITKHIHDGLHSAAAEAYGEPLLGGYKSPRSTYFWRLHGLIDSWRAQWVKLHPDS